jgi:hypothetical protein
MTKFEQVMANLRESLAHATPAEDGQPSYCMVRKDELEALIECAKACGSSHYEPRDFALNQLEACADE